MLMKDDFVFSMLYFVPHVVYVYLCIVIIELKNVDVNKFLIDQILESVLTTIILFVPATYFTQIQEKRLTQSKFSTPIHWMLLFTFSGLILATVDIGNDSINAPSLFTSNEYRILKMISISFYPLCLLLIVKIAGQTCAKRDYQGLLPYFPIHIYIYTYIHIYIYIYLKNSLIIQEQNTKKNHKRVVVLYVIKNHVNLHKL
jgi:hypothetical protein